MAEYKGKKVTLNKPTRGDRKKFKVYVKNDKGNVVKVEFGDPNMEIKRDNPERRKSFRARHKCDNPGPKWKARYWSCKMWGKTPVSKLTSSDYRNVITATAEQKIIHAKDGLWENIHKKRQRGEKPAKPGDEDYPDKKGWDKAKKSSEKKAGVMDSPTDSSEYAEGAMVLRQLKAIEEMIEHLEPHVSENMKLEPWLIGKISSAKTNLQNVYDYILSSEEHQEGKHEEY